MDNNLRKIEHEITLLANEAEYFRDDPAFELTESNPMYGYYDVMLTKYTIILDWIKNGALEYTDDSLTSIILAIMNKLREEYESADICKDESYVWAMKSMKELYNKCR